MSGRIPKDLRKLVRWLRSEGYTVDVSKGGHLVVEGDDWKVYMSSTPSDWRAVKNFRAQLRRVGVDIPKEYR